MKLLCPLVSVCCGTVQGSEIGVYIYDCVADNQPFHQKYNTL